MPLHCGLLLSVESQIANNDLWICNVSGLDFTFLSFDKTQFLPDLHSYKSISSFAFLEI